MKNFRSEKGDELADRAKAIYAKHAKEAEARKAGIKGMLGGKPAYD